MKIFNEQSYIRENIDGAYREGYYIEVPNFSGVLTNDTVIAVGWEEDSEATYVTVPGNGGYYDFYGKKLTSFLVSSDSLYDDGFLNLEFIRDEKKFIGYDDNTSCSHYDRNGIRTENLENNPSDIYACWHDRPDGIYMNDVLFKENTEDCYKRVDFATSTEPPSLHMNIYIDSIRYVIDFLDIMDEKSFTFSIISLTNVRSIRDNPSTFSSRNTSFQIVNNSSIILSLTPDDLEELENPSSRLIYGITNQEKKTILLNYLQQVYETCNENIIPPSN